MKARSQAATRPWSCACLPTNGESGWRAKRAASCAGARSRVVEPPSTDSTVTAWLTSRRVASSSRMSPGRAECASRTARSLTTPDCINPPETRTSPVAIPMPGLQLDADLVACLHGAAHCARRGIVFAQHRQAKYHACRNWVANEERTRVVPGHCQNSVPGPRPVAMCRIPIHGVR